VPRGVPVSAGLWSTPRDPCGPCALWPGHPGTESSRAAARDRAIQGRALRNHASRNHASRNHASRNHASRCRASRCRATGTGRPLLSDLDREPESGQQGWPPSRARARRARRAGPGPGPAPGAGASRVNLAAAGLVGISMRRCWSQQGRGRSLAAYREHLRPSRGLDGMKVLKPGNCLLKCRISRGASSGVRATMRKGRAPEHPDIWVPPTAL
jgi:hypothetical protein